MQVEEINLTRIADNKLVITGDNNMIPQATKLGSIEIENLGSLPELKDLGGDSVAVDVGGFVGDTAITLLKTGATVYAFEPFFDAFVCMVWNCRNYSNFFPYNMPVGDGVKVDLFGVEPAKNRGIRYVKAGSQVASFRIDDLGLQRCDFIKLDCEGFEVSALKGMEKTIERCRPILFVEMYDGALRRNKQTPESLKAKIESMGYSLRMVGVPPRWDWMCHPL